MASMGFNESTVQTLMSLVDDHKDDLKEAQYIMVCNALVHLHCTQEHSQREWAQAQPPRTFPPAPQPPATALQRTDSIFSQVSEYAFTEFNRLRHDLRLFNIQLINRQNALADERTSSLRLINVDKQKVLQRFGYQGISSNQALKTVYDELIESGRMIVPEYKRLCINEKNARRAENLREYSRLVDESERKVSDTRQQLARLINR
jgi:hypothetical protein